MSDRLKSTLTAATPICAAKARDFAGTLLAKPLFAALEHSVRAWHENQKELCQVIAVLARVFLKGWREKQGLPGRYSELPAERIIQKYIDKIADIVHNTA